MKSYDRPAIERKTDLKAQMKKNRGSRRGGGMMSYDV